jgi:hypothetical protein
VSQPRNAVEQQPDLGIADGGRGFVEENYRVGDLEEVCEDESLGDFHHLPFSVSRCIFHRWRV